MGRPSKYNKKYCAELIEHLGKGLSYKAFAGKIKVNLDTLYAWEKRHKAFSEAKKEGKQRELLFWETLYVRAAMGHNTVIEKRPDGSKFEKKLTPNSTLIIFAMKNKFGWRDKSDVEVKETVDHTVNLNVNFV